ncbi:head-tail adaptor protein, partial [Staphylococcus sp. GDB8P47P]|uniref:phage head completion protein n=1 Tax=Staphylococcus sp. GDB8P47P TaxID=2804448 RepID=UPI001953EEA8
LAQTGRLSSVDPNLQNIPVRLDEGGYEEVPTTIATPFCEVSKTTIKEFRNEDLDTRRETIVFIIRYRQKADIHSGLFVDFKGKQYKIVAIETDFQ